MTLDPTRHVEANNKAPTPQQNNPIYAGAIFSQDVVLRELRQIVEFAPSFAWLPEICRLMYTKINSDDDRLSQKLSIDMLAYHSACLLW